jgi:penicillin-binding protein 2
MIPASRRRLIVLYAVIAALLITLGGRLWYLQVMTGVSYASAATQDQTRTVIVPPVRGQILDDTGQPLVDNHTALVVSVNRMLLQQQPDGGVTELHRLAKLLHMKYSLLQDKLRLCTASVPAPCWQGSPYQPIPVDQHVPDSVALEIMESQSEYPGVTAEPQPVVHYSQPAGTAAAQLIGYLQPITPQEVKARHLPITGFSGVDLVGQAGLEEQYDQQLRGTPGRQTLSVNAAGTVTGTGRTTSATPGNDLVTSLNSQLEGDTYSALAQALTKAQQEGNTGATTGAAVVMTTKGRVLAMASYPSYDPAVWTGGISNRQFHDLFGTAHGEPILNRATQGQYAPGSTWKVTSTAAAIANGMSPNGPYSCPGSVTIAGHTFNNWTTSNLGPMSLHEALVMSCDTVFYQIAYQMYLHDRYNANFRASASAPVQRMQKMELAFGFGRYTRVDLPEESPGTVPTRQWLYNYWKQYKHYWCTHGNANGSYLQQVAYDNCRTGYQWTPGQAAIAAIGQGYVTVTPLQLARAYAAIANGGTLYNPRIGSALLSPSGKLIKRIKPHVAGHLPVSRGTLNYIKDSLVGVVTSGTAAGAFSGFPLSKVPIAAKTGTAEVFGGQATSVFASFAPANDPKYVVVVMVPKSGEGADVSAPCARVIWDDIFGLEHHQAVFPNGVAPKKLPQISGSGAITPPPGYAPSPAASPGTKPGKQQAATTSSQGAH